MITNRGFREVLRQSVAAAVLLAAMGRSAAQAAEAFPAGVNGDLYYCPRIDLNPPKDGGPLSIDLDGNLDEEAWQRAAFHTWTEYWKGGQQPQNDADSSMRWAAVADETHLYVAWEVLDDNIHAGEEVGCGAFGDDTMEVYFDAGGEGITCGGCGYGPDDVQLLVNRGESSNDDPTQLEVGYLRGGGCIKAGVIVDDITTQNLIQGIIAESGDDPGWRGEIAIAFENNSTGQWLVDAAHGTTVGFDMHLDDDDSGGGQDSGDTVLIWSKRDGGSQAWRTPGVWGKLQFFDPNNALISITRTIPANLRNGDSGTVTLKVRPEFGQGQVTVREELPDLIVGSNPSNGGTLTNNILEWNLGTLTAEVDLTYTIAIDPNAFDSAFIGSGELNGDPVQVFGDQAYTGSPFSPEGFIKLWSHLGPFATGLPDAESCMTPDISLDWIANDAGTITEADIAPFPGMVVRPEYGGDGAGNGARARGLRLANGGSAESPAVWRAGLSASDTIDHASPVVHGFDANNHVTLSAVYVTNHGAPVETLMGTGSDDSIQVYLGDTALAPISLCRGWGGTGEEQDVVLVTLPAGETRILVKVADGGGASGFRLRFQDPNDPDPTDFLIPGLLPPRITVSLESSATPAPLQVVREIIEEVIPPGGSVEVRLHVTSPRPVNVQLHEVPPALTTAADVSSGGVILGGAIVWNLTAVTDVTVTYRLVLASCASVSTLVWGLSTWKVDEIEGVITGESTLEPPSLSDEPLAWSVLDLNTEAQAQVVDAHSVILAAGPGGASGTQDQLRFLYVPTAGDFELTARIDCLDDLAGAAQAGLMVRDTVDPFSAHAFFFMNGVPPTGGGVGTLKGVFRRETNPSRSVSLINPNPRDVTSLPIYLKLKRAEGKITFERSDDGVAYAVVAGKDIGTSNTQINLRNDTLVGLAVTGGADGKVRVTFSEVSGPSLQTDVGPTFRRGDSDSNGILDLSDAIQLLGYLFLGGEQPVCMDAADVNDDGVADISDAVGNLGYQFLGGEAPKDPGPENCGKDPTPDAPVELGCVKACP